MYVAKTEPGGILVKTLEVASATTIGAHESSDQFQYLDHDMSVNNNEVLCQISLHYPVHEV